MRTKRCLWGVAVPGARRHHFVPRFYLDGFKRSAAERGLWVTDTDRGHQYQAVTKDIAVERDYNRIEVPGVDPNAMEDELSRVEARAAVIIREIAETQVLPQGEAVEELMFFVALLHSRVPGYRRNWAQGFGRVAEIAEQLMAMPDEAKRNFPPVMGSDSPGIPYSELRKLIKQVEPRPELHNDVYVDLMVASATVVTPLLLKRHWTIVVARKDAGDLICSDRPVGLTWTTQALGQSFYSPGFGLRNTIVTVPLNRRLALWGTWDRRRGTVALDSDGVAIINSRTAMYSERYLYSARQNFRYVDPQNKVTEIESLLKRIRSE